MKKESISDSTEQVEMKNRAAYGWAKQHKIELIFAGVGITAIVGFLLYKGINPEQIETFIKAVKKGTKATFSAVEPIENASEITVAVTKSADAGTKIISVNSFIRNMSEAYSPSAAKLAQAEAMNIELGPHQTIVDAFTRRITA